MPRLNPVGLLSAVPHLCLCLCADVCSRSVLRRLGLRDHPVCSQQGDQRLPQEVCRQLQMEGAKGTQLPRPLQAAAAAAAAASEQVRRSSERCGTGAGDAAARIERTDICVARVCEQRERRIRRGGERVRDRSAVPTVRENRLRSRVHNSYPRNTAVGHAVFTFS